MTAVETALEGTFRLILRDDFETNNGWSHSASESTASTGDWLRGNPDGTEYQPEDDVTPDPGVNCLFTATNAGGLGSDDVDAGVGVESIEDLYVGFFADGDVGHRDREEYWMDDATDLWEGTVCAMTGGREIPFKVSIAYFYDKDGDEGQAPGYFGILFLGRGGGTGLVPVVALSIAGEELAELERISWTILQRAQKPTFSS